MQAETEKKYNGWTNYETWLVKLWIDNDAGYNCWPEITREVWVDCDHDRDDTAYKLSERLKSEHEDNAPTGESGIYTDLLNAALSEVDWYEIAESMIEDEEFEDEADESK